MSKEIQIHFKLDVPEPYSYEVWYKFGIPDTLGKMDVNTFSRTRAAMNIFEKLEKAGLLTMEYVED